jgi:hypothetical protein
MFKKGKVAVIIVIALILSVTTYAFAAANTVPVTAAGDGNGQITGYKISSIVYVLDSTNTNITGVNFTASLPAGATAPDVTPKFQVFITGSSTVWSTKCDVTGTGSSLTVVCTGTFGTVYAANNLRVVASN